MFEERKRELDRALAAVLAGQRAGDLETSTLDFKRPKPEAEESYKDLAEAAICFANSRGGVLVVGVDDRVPGRAALVGTTLDSNELTRRIHQLTNPPLLVQADVHPFEQKRLLAIYVPNSPAIHADTRGRATHRVHTDCVPMGPADYERVREQKSGVDWSAKASDRSAVDASPEALAAARRALSALTDYRQELSRLGDRDLLNAVGVLSPEKRLNMAGELLFCVPTGREPAAIVYQYRATPGGEPRDIQRIDAPLVLALQRLLDLVRARRTLTAITLPNGQALELADFPELAVREAFVNGLIHRDYHQQGSVSIEHSPEVLVVTSPGPLVAGVTPENILTHPSAPRNPALAKAIRMLGFAEDVGRGVDRMYREMIRAGRDLPRIESSPDRVRLSLVGGAPNTRIARFVAQLPPEERDDTDTMLVLFRLCTQKTVVASATSLLLQKTEQETEAILRRLSGDQIGLLEATRQSIRRTYPTYRLRSEPLRALGSAVSYQRRTTDETDRKIISHVREYGKVTNKTIQNLFDVGIQRARDILRDLVLREVLEKASDHERGPGVEYGPGPRFPASRRGSRPRNRSSRQASLPLESKGGPPPRRK